MPELRTIVPLSGDARNAPLFMPPLTHVFVISCAAWHLLSRLAYVSFLISELPEQSRLSEDRDPVDGEAVYESFCRKVFWLQLWDAVSFGLLCVATSGSLPVAGLNISAIGAGAVLVTLGIYSKMLAAATLGPGSYTWRDFFVRLSSFEPCKRGIYAILKDPMYTVGYLHAYGVALCFLSWPGLVAATFCQATMLFMSRKVERPHMERLSLRAR